MSRRNTGVQMVSKKLIAVMKFVKNLSSDYLTAFSLVTIFFVLASALITTVLLSTGIVSHSIYSGISLDERHQPPSIEHPLGTDHLGRDILVRLVFGTRILIYVILVSVTLSIILGTSLGLISGYLGGSVDLILSRIIDAIMCFPAVLLALAIITILGPGVENVVVAIGIAESPVFARLARGLVVVEKEKLYVEAARAIGTGKWRILIEHIVPNIAGPILVQATFTSSSAILWEAALSFLGLGTQPPTPSWGLMLYEAKDYMRQAPHSILIPGLAIFIVVLSINVVGEKLRDLIDPKYKTILSRHK